jgi:hypothetical protein
MRGAKAGAVEAGLGGGTLEAELDHNGEAYHLTGKWDAIDLRQLAFLRRKVEQGKAMPRTPKTQPKP